MVDRLNCGNSERYERLLHPQQAWLQSQAVPQADYPYGVPWE